MVPIFSALISTWPEKLARTAAASASADTSDRFGCAFTAAIASALASPSSSTRLPSAFLRLKLSASIICGVPEQAVTAPLSSKLT